MYPDYPDPMPAFAYIGHQGRAMLESALAEPGQGFGGRYLHRTMPDKAAALLRSIIKNHPLVDGNKRLALTATIVFYISNGWLFFVPRDEAVSRCLEIASAAGNVDVKEIVAWMRPKAFSLQRLDRMTELELRQTLDAIAPETSDARELSIQLIRLRSFLQRYNDSSREAYRATQT
jgi:death-on-curing protein